MFKRVILVFLVSCIFLATSISAFSQALPVFKMPSHKDTTITDCKGEFYDSDAGPNQNYLAQARDTFRICTGGTISMTFLSFQLENGLDSLAFYNGNTISSATLIGKYTGSNMPSGITANGCLTIVFKSSFVLQDQGWVARWTSTVTPPVPPNISISPAPNCNTTTVDVAFSKNVHCDSIYASAFQLTGPITPIVTGASAIGCVGDSTRNARIQLGIPLTQNCNYNMAFTINMLDRCDSVWTFTVNNSFTINNCVVSVSIDASPNDTICSGTCTQLQSVINSCLSYNYYWSHGLANSPSHNVCPPSTTTYTLGVQSTSGGPMYTSSLRVEVINPQITVPASNPVCQSLAPFSLIAVPSGGTWRGKGITDSIQGTFDPDTAMQGAHLITYNLNGLCSSSVTMSVTPMDAGFDEAACPGASSFNLSGNLPAGGTWSGYSGVTGGGVFTPSTLGTYTVTYSHPNGCTDTKQVFVQSVSISNTTDTVCQSAGTYTLNFSPPGGRWDDVSGVIDTLNGVIDTWTLGGGMHNLIYRLNGCTDTARIYIKPIFAGWDFSRCPSQASFTLTQANPAGGIWSSGGTSNNGPSAIVNGSGLFNPGIQGMVDFTDTLIYTAVNGCTDSVLSYISITNIIEDTLLFCSDDSSIRLEWGITRNYPWGGVWTGAAVTKSGNDFYFNPSAAGVGIHTLTYNANTCTDIIQMVVYPAQLSYNDTTICTIHPAFILDPIGLSANWTGQGITNSSTGLFDPTASGLGTHAIAYSTPSGCHDTINVTVYLYRDAAIGGLNSTYCYRNFDYPFTLVPAGGTLIGTGIVNGGTAFNPSVAGEGQHTLYYSFGSGPCYTIDSLTIDVYPPITTTVTVTNSPICRSEAAIIDVQSSGGSPLATNHTYTWSNGLFSTNRHVLSPPVTTTYTVTTSDGCSDNAVDTARIVANPDFTLSFTTSPIDCNGKDGTANVSVAGVNTYGYLWSTSPPENNNTINGIAGNSYSVRVTDVSTGCFKDSSITIPGYGIINALFSVNPNMECIPYTQNAVTFIDLSLGATQGFWDFGNDSIVAYTRGVNPQTIYPQSGEYKVTLHVENIGNCPSEKTIDVCILDPVSIFVPDIFSPNGDGNNDVLYVRGKGIRELSFTVYDRWGEKVFETNKPDKGWDGTFKGAQAQTDVYVWYLNATMFDGTQIVNKGDITLIR